MLSTLALAMYALGNVFVQGSRLVSQVGARVVPCSRWTRLPHQGSDQHSPYRGTRTRRESGDEHSQRINECQ